MAFGLSTLAGLSAINPAFSDVSEPHFDIGQRFLTPEVIKKMTGQDVVLIDMSKPDSQTRVREELETAKSPDGIPLNLDQETIESLISDASNSAAGTTSFSSDPAMIFFNKEDWLAANSPEGWNQMALGAGESDPEYVTGVKSHEHPALIGNMSILTEVSHSLWIRESNTSAEKMFAQNMKDNPTILNSPFYKKLIEAGHNNEKAAKYAANELIFVDSIKMEIQGDRDALKWTQEWAENNRRPDITEASHDFTSSRISRPFLPSIIIDALNKDMLSESLDTDGNPISKDVEIKFHEKIVGLLEDKIAGLGSVLAEQGAVPRTMEDIDKISDTLDKAHAILNEHFHSKMPDGEPFNPSIGAMHKVIVEVYQTGKLPELPDDTSESLKVTGDEALRVKDAMVSYGIAIERSTPNFNPPSLLSIIEQKSWGVKDAQKHWNFSPPPKIDLSNDQSRMPSRQGMELNP